MFKVPLIFQHYAEHRKENRNLSFLRFLDLHYLHGNPKDSDHDRDMQLPFKSSADCAFGLATAFVPLMHEISIHPEPTGEGKIHTGFYTRFMPSALLADIWQPPKRG